MQRDLSQREQRTENESISLPTSYHDPVLHVLPTGLASKNNWSVLVNCSMESHPLFLFRIFFKCLRSLKMHTFALEFLVFNCLSIFICRIIIIIITQDLINIFFYYTAVFLRWDIRRFKTNRTSFPALDHRIKNCIILT